MTQTQPRFWHLDGVDRDTGEDVTGYLTTYSEDELPGLYEEYRDKILYFEVEDDEEAESLANDLMFYTLVEKPLLPFHIVYN
jgi:hypothetical protein